MQWGPELVDFTLMCIRFTGYSFFAFPGAKYLNCDQDDRSNAYQCPDIIRSVQFSKLYLEAIIWSKCSPSDVHNVYRKGPFDQ